MFFWHHLQDRNVLVITHKIEMFTSLRSQTESTNFSSQWCCKHFHHHHHHHWHQHPVIDIIIIIIIIWEEGGLSIPLPYSDSLKESETSIRQDFKEFAHIYTNLYTYMNKYLNVMIPMLLCKWVTKFSWP